MTAASIPGVVANMRRKNGAVRDVRRMAALERAADMVGGKVALADVMGIGVRLLHQKIAAERPIHDADLRLAERAVSAHAVAAQQFACRLLALIHEAAA